MQSEIHSSSSSISALLWNINGPLDENVELTSQQNA